MEQLRASCVQIIVPFKYSIQTGRGVVLRSWHHAEGISFTVRRSDRLSDDLRHRFGAGPLGFEFRDIRAGHEGFAARA